MKPLLTLKDAAGLLGYKVKGLRKIIDRSRIKAQGGRTRGPTITFCQAGPGSPIKFKEEWIEDFVHENTVKATNGVAKHKKRRGKVELDFD